MWPGALGLTVALETKGELAIAVHRNGNHSQGRGYLRPRSVPETKPRENQRDIMHHGPSLDPGWP